MQTVTEQNRLDTLADNVIHREREVFTYQINIDNYTTMLASLPDGEWPEYLAQYVNTSTDDLPVSMSDEDVSLVADYQYRDRIRKLLRAEKVEQGKARRVYEALIRQLPTSESDALIAAAKARIDGKEAVAEPAA